MEVRVVRLQLGRGLRRRRARRALAGAEREDVFPSVRPEPPLRCAVWSATARVALLGVRMRANDCRAEAARARAAAAD
jgi:hypothetical protein